MNAYGQIGYGDAFYGESPGTGGGQTIWHEVYQADLSNAQLADLTAPFYATPSSEVGLNHDRVIKAQGSLAIRGPDQLRPYRDYLAVWLNRAYDDGRPPQRDQLGLFEVRVPPGTRTVERAEAIYTGYDLTATLARYAFTQGYNIAAASNYVSAVLDILALAGITRTLIEPTTQATSAVISFAVGTSYLDAANTLLQAIGYYQLAAMPDGTLMSMPSRPLHLVEPYRTITDADLMAPVEIQPLDTTVANVVIVVKNNPDSAPLTAIRRNDDPDSPTSTVNLGTIARTPQEYAELADQAAVDALADRLLSEGRSFYQTAKIAMLPDPRALVPHQTIRLDLTGQLAILNGLWWVRTAVLPLDTRATTLELNRTTDGINGQLI